MNDAESQADEMRLLGTWWASQTVSRVFDKNKRESLRE
jgi:hypothetical protein